FGRSGAGLAQLARRVEDRRPAHHHRTRMEGTESFLEQRGRPMEDANLLDRQSERLGRDLRAYRLQTLADVRRADVDGCTALVIELDARVLARAGRAAFDEAGDRRAVVAAIDQLAIQLRFLLPAEFREAALERRGIVAGVELLLLFRRSHSRERIRQLIRPWQIPPAELDRIDAEVARRHVEQPLAEEISLEAAGAAIRADRRLVREMRVRLDVDIRHAIRPGEELRDVARRNGAVGAEIGADIDPDLAAQGHDVPVALAEDLELRLHLARMVRRHQVLAPVLGPFHRPPEAPRGEWNQEIFRIELAAHAEAAADVGLEHVDALFGQVHVL